MKPCALQVFDGHSGAGAAHFARDHLCDYFAGYLQADNLEPNEMQEAMVSLLPFLCKNTADTLQITCLCAQGALACPCLTAYTDVYRCKHFYAQIASYIQPAMAQ